MHESKRIIFFFFQVTNNCNNQLLGNYSNNLNYYIVPSVLFNPSSNKSNQSSGFSGGSGAEKNTSMIISKIHKMERYY